MEVPVSVLRAELKSWIARAGEGEQIIVTDRGVPVARLTGVEGVDLIEGLQRDGLLTPPQADRPPAPQDQPHPTQPGGLSGIVRRRRR